MIRGAAPTTRLPQWAEDGRTDGQQPAGRSWSPSCFLRVCFPGSGQVCFKPPKEELSLINKRTLKTVEKNVFSQLPAERCQSRSVDTKIDMIECLRVSPLPSENPGSSTARPPPGDLRRRHRHPPADGSQGRSPSAAPLGGSGDVRSHGLDPWGSSWARGPHAQPFLGVLVTQPPERSLQGSEDGSPLTS